MCSCAWCLLAFSSWTRKSKAARHFVPVRHHIHGEAKHYGPLAPPSWAINRRVDGGCGLDLQHSCFNCSGNCFARCYEQRWGCDFLHLLFRRFVVEQLVRIATKVVESATRKQRPLLHAWPFLFEQKYQLFWRRGSVRRLGHCIRLLVERLDSSHNGRYVLFLSYPWQRKVPSWPLQVRVAKLCRNNQILYSFLMLVLEQWTCLKYQTSGSSQGLNVYIWVHCFVRLWDYKLQSVWCGCCFPLLSFDNARFAATKNVTNFHEIFLHSCSVRYCIWLSVHNLCHFTFYSYSHGFLCCMAV